MLHTLDTNTTTEKKLFLVHGQSELRVARVFKHDRAINAPTL